MALGEPERWHYDPRDYRYVPSPPPTTYTPIGWQCPICGQVYGPTVQTCFKQHSAGYSTTTNTIKITANADPQETAKEVAENISRYKKRKGK